MATLRKWRTPLLIGGGGLVALTAFQRSREGTAAAQAAAAVATQPAGVAPALTPEQTAALIAQGGAQSLAAMQAGLAPTTDALGLAGLLGSGAQGLAAASIGQFGELAGLAGQLVGILPSFAPAGGITPQPTIPPAAPPPSTTPPPPGSSPPPATITERFDGYEILLRPGSYTLYSGARSENRRTIAIGGSGTSARGARVTSPWLQWRFTSGSFTGWSMIPGKSGGFSVNRLYRRSDGSLRRVNIGQSGQ